MSVAAPPFPIIPSAVALVVANLVPLGGALFLDWRVYDVLAIFWMENVVIGLLNVARMATLLVVKKSYDAILMIPFFTLHYGMFSYVHGVFISGMFGESENRGFTDIPLGDADLFLALLALFASHLFSFVINFIGKREYEQTDTRALMSAPYKRIVVLHLAILFGGMAAAALGEGIFALVLLVTLKTAIDLATHIAERRKMGKTPAQ